jgi:hypothetical protein
MHQIADQKVLTILSRLHKEASIAAFLPLTGVEKGGFEG